MNVTIEPSWKTALEDEFQKEYFRTLATKVKEAYLKELVYPPPKQLFNAFTLTPFDRVKVVIIGQDPYHGPHQAHGLAFSVPEGIAVPPSLVNIYKELASDLGIAHTDSGNLEDWATQGVLLLNSSLTVRAGEAASHRPLGWEQFTDAVITLVSRQREHVVFILWGAHAIAKRSLIDEAKHLVLTAPHPSPLSAHRGFFGSKPFSQTNAYLVAHYETPIAW